MAAQQTPARYLASNSKQLLRKLQAAFPIALQQSRHECGHLVKVNSASGELRQHRINRLPLLRKSIQTSQENKLPSENANSYVIL